MIYQLRTLPENYIWISGNFTTYCYLSITNPLNPPWQWRGALVAGGVELDQSRGGACIGASERVDVGDPFVELRPWRPERVERPWRRGIFRRNFSGGGGGGGGSHRVRDRE